jgi:glycerophosphoryl diester phosphodiesterase
MRFSWLVLCLFLLGCNKKSDFTNIQIIGHAGMGLDMPNSMYHDNSKEAIEYALSINGCNGVEVDVQMSKDGQLWLYHDPTLETQTNATGCIYDKTSDELEQIKYSSFHFEKLAKLKQLNADLLIGKTLYLDMRNFESCNNTILSTNLILNAVNQIEFLQNSAIEVVVISADVNFLKQLHLAGYNVALEISDPATFESYLAQFPEIKEVIFKSKSISKERLTTIQEMGINVTLFEMRSASGIRNALKKLPNSIITDDLRESIIEVY